MPIKILVVDDMEFNRELTARFLKIAGFDALFANDGKQAIEIARKNHPSLILMDIALPDMDGWEVTKIIKSNDNTKDIPIIALTAHDTNGYRDKAETYGCSGFISKPIDFSLLVGKINESLNIDDQSSGQMNN